jgi:hypothetical protein
MKKISVVVGQRYRRIYPPHRHVWVRSYDGTSVVLITRSGPAMMPVAAFVEKFEPDPVREPEKIKCNCDPVSAIDGYVIKTPWHHATTCPHYADPPE